MRIGGVHLNSHPGELIGVVLLYDGGALGGGAFASLFQVEPAGLSAKTHGCVDFLGSFRIIFLEKCQIRSPIAAIESSEPGRNLMGRGRVGQSYLPE